MSRDANVLASVPWLMSCHGSERPGGLQPHRELSASSELISRARKGADVPKYPPLSRGSCPAVALKGLAGLERPWAQHIGAWGRKAVFLVCFGQTVAYC